MPPLFVLLRAGCAVSRRWRQDLTVHSQTLPSENGWYIHFQYEMNTGAFTYTWVHSTPNPARQTRLKGKESVFQPPRMGHPALTSLETEIFLPSQLARGRRVIVKGLDLGDKHRYDESCRRYSLCVRTQALTSSIALRFLWILRWLLRLQLTTLGVIFGMIVSILLRLSLTFSFFELIGHTLRGLYSVDGLCYKLSTYYLHAK